MSTWRERSVSDHPTAWRVAFVAILIAVVAASEVVMWLAIAHGNERSGRSMGLWYPILLQVIAVGGYFVVKYIRSRRR